MLKTQVVIIGAGPTGLSLAVQLLRYKIDFIILEKNEKTTHLSKAIVIQARSLEIFEETGLAGKAIKEGRMTTAFNMFHNGKKRVRLNLAGLGEGLSQFPFALSLEQSKTEELLVKYLGENGKSIDWKSEFTHSEQTTSGVRVFYKDPTGVEQSIEADYLVGCDGSKSPVRHQIGQGFEGDTASKLFYVTDVRLSSEVVNKDELFIFLIKKGFILFFPMEGEGHYRVIGILPDHEEGQHVDFETIKAEVEKQVMVPLHFEEVMWFSTYKVHSRKADLFRNRNMFIAGDAAHIHTPAGGQGMNTGIQDAYNLGWKLAFTINYKLNDLVLESYNTERTANAARLLRTTDRMFELFTGASWFSNFIRLKLFPLIARFISRNKFFNKRIFPLLSMTSIAYPGSALTIKSSIGKTKAGMRMPYFVFKDGKNIFDFLTYPGFKILFFGTNGLSKIEGLERSSFEVIFHSFTEIPKHLFGSNVDFYVLLRPDNHISYIGKETKEIVDFFHKLFGGKPVIKG